jgi:hypothetical protein
MLVELSQAQDAEAGDGTTSVVILAGVYPGLAAWKSMLMLEHRIQSSFWSMEVKVNYVFALTKYQ